MAKEKEIKEDKEKEETTEVEKKKEEKETRTEKNSEIIKDIESERTKERNKKIFKIFMIIFIPLFILFTISYICLRYIGNIGITVREYPVYSGRINEELNGLKIVQFSDLHYGKYSSISDIKKLVNLINKTNPDIVIFTGDLINKDYQLSNEDKEAIMSEFNSINSTIGKYAIKGEEDNEDFNNIFDNSNFIILDNKIEKIHYKNSIINLIAVDENYNNSEIVLDNNYFTIVAVHKPDLADQIIEDYNPNMIVAGHSHNGQVRLPLIGPVMRKEGSKKYISSYYQIGDTELFISGGIGNSKFNFRLFNHPSINFYRLRSK